MTIADETIETVYVPLNNQMRFYPNPYGNGVMLALERGIPCAAHTQVFSAHTTDHLELGVIQLAVEEMREELNRQYEAFVDLIATLQMERVSEQIADLFFGDLVRRVATKSLPEAVRKFNMSANRRLMVLGLNPNEPLTCVCGRCRGKKFDVFSPQRASRKCPACKGRGVIEVQKIKR